MGDDATAAPAWTMTESHTATEAEPADHRDGDRYGCVELPDGEVVVYDRDSHTQWVQSDWAVPVSELR